jgi:hypothetical protein
MIGLFVIVIWLSLFFFLNKFRNLYPSNPKLQLTYITGPTIDVIVQQHESISRLTILSILKFMPWVRFIHVENENEINNDKIIIFNQNLLHYSIVTPLLSEHFIVISPGCIITNYMFASQFFINNRPVIRAKNDVFGLTRTIFNENAFYQHKQCPFLFAQRKAIKVGKIIHKSKPLIHVSNYTNYTQETFDDFKIIAKNSKKFIVILTDSYDCNIDFNEDAIPIFIKINKREPIYSYERLHFIQRAISMNGKAFEMIPMKTTLELFAVEISRKINDCYPYQKPIFVMGSKETSDLGNKIANIFDVGYKFFSVPFDNYEFKLRSKLLQL